MVTRAIKGTGEKEGFRTNENLIFKTLCSKKKKNTR
jgi:hypothetical protein